MKEKIYKGTVAGLGALASAKLGILLPVLWVLMGAMVTDYITGILKSKYTNVKVNSRNGIWGIVKKVAYIVLVMMGIALDWLILNLAGELGLTISARTFFGLLVTLWLILNEFTSILENLVIMEVALPPFIQKLVKNFKVTVEKVGDNTEIKKEE